MYDFAAIFAFSELDFAPENAYYDLQCVFNQAYVNSESQKRTS